MSRYAVFIDGGYLNKILKDLNVKISFLKLSEEFANGEERFRTYYYDCSPYMTPTPTEEEKRRKSRFDKFIYYLQREPRFLIRLGRLQRIGNNFNQKMVDILLSLDLVKLSLEHQIQRAVLITGDSDYVPAIKIAKDAGTIIQLCYYERKSNPKDPNDKGFPHPHDELLESCDEWKLITSHLIKKIKR